MIASANELCLNDLKGKCRALCVDYGEKRVGVAISDINWKIASPLLVLENHGVYSRLLEIINEQDVGVIVVGAPLALNGESGGKQLEKVQRFVDNLEKKVNTPIVMWDERLSTHGADRVLTNACITKYKRRTYIDKIAASFILEGFLYYCENIGIRGDNLSYSSKL